MGSLWRWIAWVYGFMAKHRLGVVLGSLFTFLVGLAQLSGFNLRDPPVWKPVTPTLTDEARLALRGRMRALASDGSLSVDESRRLRDYVAGLSLDLEEAEKYLTQIEPQMLQAARDLQEGLELAAQERFSEARIRFREATRLDEESATAWANFGGAALELAAVTEAEAALRKALALEPESIAANYNLGACLAAQSRTTAALEHLERSMALLLRGDGQPSFERQALLRDLENSAHFASLRATPRFIALLQRAHDIGP